MMLIASAAIAVTVLSSFSSAQLPGQAYIVTINGTVTTIIEPLDAPAATFIGTDSLGVTTTAETTDPVTSTTPVDVSLTQFIGASTPTSTTFTTSSASAAIPTIPSASEAGSFSSPSVASGLRSCANVALRLTVPLGVIILTILK